MNIKSDRQKRPKVVLVIRAIVQNEDGLILIIKRSPSDSYMPNKWELPGGKLDIGQDISNALEREVLEETGLVVIPTDKIAYWRSEIISSGKYKGLPYVILVGLSKSVGGEVAISSEHSDFKWLRVKEALKYDLVIESRTALVVLVNKLS
ncbi:NUDIX domain-containing protein [Patescibacteria group bacterium]|nr:NUDIX domain-containing protein [Patescibacteria group bacterium]MBU1952896.1 NUDIX domain-containing protein [Patescibacteria group bacterium]